MTSANGSIDGCTVTWEPSLTEPTSFEATANDSGGCTESIKWWAWILIGLGVLVLIGGIVAIVRTIKKEKSRGPSSPPTGPAAAASSGAAVTAASTDDLPPESTPLTMPPPEPPTPPPAELADLPAPTAPPADTGSLPDLPGPVPDAGDAVDSGRCLTCRTCLDRRRTPGRSRRRLHRVPQASRRPNPRTEPWPGR